MKSVKIKTKWDLTSLLGSENDKEIEKQKSLIKKENYKFINKWKDRKDYLKEPLILKGALDEIRKTKSAVRQFWRSRFLFLSKISS